MTQKHDVVIVGGGVGGLVAGALLAKLDRRRVLVLEKQSVAGGRVVSFGGPHGAYSAEAYERILKGAAGVRVLRAWPSLDEIVDRKKIFDDFIIDPGWHLVTGASRNRYSMLAEALGKSIPVRPQVGLFIDKDGEFVELAHMTKDWPEESRREHRRVAKMRIGISMAESARYDHIDLASYLRSQTDDQRVIDYYTWLGRYLLVVNDPTELSAGEFIRTNNMPLAAGMHLSTGGGSGEVAGGFKRIADVFSEIITENGGEVRTNAGVEEVLLDGYRATGVRLSEEAGGDPIDADVVIVNVPVDALGKLVPRESFPPEMRKRIDNVRPATGITGFIGVKELIEPAHPRACFVLETLPGAPKIRGGSALIGFEQTTGVDPSRRLHDDAGHYIQTWSILSTAGPDERQDDALLQQLVDAQLEWFRARYPSFEDNLLWHIHVLAERVYGVSPEPGMVGDRKVPVAHPLVPNLFFAGDTVEQTDVGTNGAAHAALLCANAVSGRNFLSLVPDYLR
ncbi:phytoene desaturase family protein [Nocardia sp. R16R-3T]